MLQMADISFQLFSTLATNISQGAKDERNKMIYKHNDKMINAVMNASIFLGTNE